MASIGGSSWPYGERTLVVYIKCDSSHFVELWLLFCKKLKVEPTSLEAYFQTTLELVDNSVIPKTRGNEDSGGGKFDEGGEEGKGNGSLLWVRPRKSRLRSNYVNNFGVHPYVFALLILWLKLWPQFKSSF
ncbi:hypothetical protein PVK06_010968 [Gossypium arboreum]|uniref:Uncharacterized protein n=1 Tax=Gossypium arboreum TaxID=29729 RepID=A0ABR0Q800_GOSAR|nr:hypothetical protein PVK06_010968 [Gossypium arboreum]